MSTNTAETCMHGRPIDEPCDPCKTMDLFKTRSRGREPIDLPAELQKIIAATTSLEESMRALAKGLTFRGQIPAEPVGDLNVAANQVKCARLFLKETLESLNG